MLEELEGGIDLPLEWHIPEDFACELATNMLIQYTGHEFILSFFRIEPPLVLGTTEEVKQQLANVKSVRAECIARVAVTASRMPGFVQALQESLAKLQTTLPESAEGK